MSGKTKRYIVIIFLVILLTSIYFYCYIVSKSGNMESWIGEYSFSEAFSEEGSAPLVMQYNIIIYKEGNQLYADVQRVGQTIMFCAKAEVVGDDKWVSLIFLDYLPENMLTHESYKNSVLISFKKDEGNIYTYWGKIQPMLYENMMSGEIYFIYKQEYLDMNNSEKLNQELQKEFYAARFIDKH